MPCSPSQARNRSLPGCPSCSACAACASEPPGARRPLLRPLSPYELKAGAFIPGALVTAVDTSRPGPVVAAVLEGPRAIAAFRQLAGGTDPVEKATPGTIRGDLAVNIGRNVIHGSDAPETAAFEIGLWFQPSELSDWSPADQVWRVEA